MILFCILYGTSFNCLGFIINSGFDGVSSYTDIIVYTLNILNIIITYYHFYFYYYYNYHYY